jgi:hypothetical protein
LKSALTLALQVGQMPWVADLMVRVDGMVYAPSASTISKHQAHWRSTCTSGGVMR